MARSDRSSALSDRPAPGRPGSVARGPASVGPEPSGGPKSKPGLRRGGFGGGSSAATPPGNADANVSAASSATPNDRRRKEGVLTGPHDHRAGSRPGHPSGQRRRGPTERPMRLRGERRVGREEVLGEGAGAGQQGHI